MRKKKRSSRGAKSRKKPAKKARKKKVRRAPSKKSKAAKKSKARARKTARKPSRRKSARGLEPSRIKEITGTVSEIRRRYEAGGGKKAPARQRLPVPTQFLGQVESPVTSILSKAPGGHEKRRYPRFQVNFELYVKGMSSEAFQGQVEDMSLSGVRIRVPRGSTPLSVLKDMAGDIFALEFVMGNETVDVANSRLVRVIEEEGRIYMAFHFGAIPDRIISKIFGMVFRASSG